MSLPTSFHWQKQVTDQSGGGNGLHPLMGRARKPHCKEHWHRKGWTILARFASIYHILQPINRSVCKKPQLPLVRAKNHCFFTICGPSINAISKVGGTFHSRWRAELTSLTQRSHRKEGSIVQQPGGQTLPTGQLGTEPSSHRAFWREVKNHPQCGREPA